ncbi:DUF3905 domain-containing protein [Paenibacillus doosanensis]|uniref:DUF3905 domain-containing protein n=1 Tax=Paenibacillus konkukensis TaxID=2020716 RepID=A0ABY4RPX1_9BACL|nr:MULTISPECIES: DUF3905 domain-containing protein [Paenibacillus]MCS7459023.1 DUF3905 domain-containing protein [Paenibacillus doosanensis]UQZ84077.1 hypothetical protein SK3146_03309 [Paenibacillus konkukensis]
MERKESGGQSLRQTSKQAKEQSELDPFEINFLPQFLEGRGPREPFVNSHGVVIGDHEYESEQSPLENWSEDVDPAVMSGDEWVHPFKDVGFHSPENKDYFEKGIVPQTGGFMHADKNVAYQAYSDNEGEEPANERGTENGFSGSK